MQLDWKYELSCADPENFLRRDQLPTRGGPTNLIIVKTHILENLGGLNPLSPSGSAHDIEKMPTTLIFVVYLF